MPTWICLAGMAAVEGRSAEVRERFAALNARSLVEHDMQWAWHAADVHAIAGLYEETLDLLGLAVRQGFSNTWMLESRDATLAPLRSDPRFASLVALAREKAAQLPTEAHS